MTVHICQGPLARTEPSDVEEAGALICFEGIVRPLEDNRRIKALDYEVYEPMAMQMLGKLAGEAAERFDLRAVHVEHSRGLVEVGACSFRLRIASAHRAEGLAATAWFIDRMKQDVPIWKRPIDYGRQEVGALR